MDIFFSNTLLSCIPWSTRIFVLVVILVFLLLGQVLNYTKTNQPKAHMSLYSKACYWCPSSIWNHFSLDAANFSLFSKEGEGYLHLLLPKFLGQLWPWGYSSPNISRVMPLLFPINSSHSLHLEHWIIQESVYVLHLITCHGRMMLLLAELLFLLDTTTGDSFSNRPYHGKTCLWTYVEREGPDQPAHPHSLIRVYTVPS